jgi:hypothetical protein
MVISRGGRGQFDRSTTGEQAASCAYQGAGITAGPADVAVLDPGWLSFRFR